MPPPQRNRFINWDLLLKDEWLPGQGRRMVDWSQAVREEPRLIWQTPQVRYMVYGLGILVGVWALMSVVSALEPAPPKGAQSRARTADIHVVCTNPECRHHFLIKREFGFDRFPVVCPRCKQKSGQRAVRCFSKGCGGKYVVPVESGGRLYCSQCGTDLGEAP